MTQIQTTLKQDKITKGAVRYAEQTDSPTKKTVYLRKDELPVPYPAEIHQTLEWDD